MNAWSAENRAVHSARMKLRHAERRKAIRQGEPAGFSPGRRPRWPIPRPWRYRLSPEDEARVLAAMLDHDVRTRGGEPRPPWQGITSRRDEACTLAALEKTWILRANDRSRPLPRAEMERLYETIVRAEHVVGDEGSAVRLRRLDWERHEYLLRARNAEAIDRAVKSAPASPDIEQRPPHEVPPDDFRDAICPPYTVESTDQLRVEIDRRRRQLAAFNLAESTARRLDSELARAGDLAAQLAVLDRWLAGMERATKTTELIVNGRDRAAYERAMRPRSQEKPRLTIDPRFK